MTTGPSHAGCMDTNRASQRCEDAHAKGIVCRLDKNFQPLFTSNDRLPFTAALYLSDRTSAQERKLNQALASPVYDSGEVGCRVFSVGHGNEQFLELPQAADFVLKASPQFGVGGAGEPGKGKRPRRINPSVRVPIIADISNDVRNICLARVHRILP